MKTFLGVPIRIRDEVFGNLYLTDKEGGSRLRRARPGVGGRPVRLGRDRDRQRSPLHEPPEPARRARASGARARGHGRDRPLGGRRDRPRAGARAGGEARPRAPRRPLPRGGARAATGEARVAAAAGEAGEDVVGQALARHRDGCRRPRSARGRPSASPTWRAAWATGSGSSPRAPPSALVAPLRFRAGTRGLLVAFDRLSGGPAFEADDEHILSSFAASAAIAIATAQSVEDERRRNSVRGLRAGAAPLGARAPRRDASGAGSAQGAARRAPASPSARDARDRGRRPGRRADPALDQRAPGPDHRAAPRGARRAGDGTGARRPDQAHRRHLRARHPGAGGPRLRAGAQPVPSRRRRSRARSSGSSRSRSRTWSSTPRRSTSRST